MKFYRRHFHSKLITLVFLFSISNSESPKSILFEILSLPKSSTLNEKTFNKFDNGLIEHELDHVLVGFVDLDLKIKINSSEVADYRWQSVLDLRDNLKDIDAQKFTPWLAPALKLALL